ncbi:MAG: YHYH protein, partial [Actinomycetes bacterium]
MQFHEHPHEHPHHHPHQHVIDRRSALRLGGLGLGGLLLAACTPTRSAMSTSIADSIASSSTLAPASTTASSLLATTTTSQAEQATTTSTIATLNTLPGFDEFASTVKVFASGDYWQVESNGLPAHNMMVGITSWQQQVPLPMTYQGSNAWQLPKEPALADNPISAKTSLYRGAIALAVNGVPIFNALNNRGDDAFLVGELDKWGGHCGRADDYHYHVAPLHLSTIVGTTKPIAYALDGFAIYGSTEPDGSTMKKLDEYNGH